MGLDLETIFALSSGSVPAGVAVIRLSGPHAMAAVEAIAGVVPPPRRASLRRFRTADGEAIDRGLVMVFPGPTSFTGEDCAEFHIHGGRAVVAAMVARLAGLPGLRPAEAGEFTRRALDNGRMDLTAVEGLADLLAAETEQQRRAALRQSEGRLAALYDGWRADLVRIRGLIEADLDFADEGDIPGTVAERAFDEARVLAGAIARHLDDGARGERLRRGVEVVILGAPNAGKSSLLNALARRDVAIVTAEAGTTRDLIEVHLDCGGFPVTVVDTAGLRAAAGVVEQEGIRRAVLRARSADLVLWLVAPSDDAAIVADRDEAVVTVPGEARDRAVWTVRTKRDLIDSDSKQAPAGGCEAADLAVSALTGAGLADLEQRLAAFAAEVCALGDEPILSRARHRTALEQGLARLRTAIESDGLALELRVEEIRLAADAIGRVTGRIGVEDWLGAIFGEFCIGK